MERTENTNICAFLVEEKRTIESKLSRAFSHWQVTLSDFDITRLTTEEVLVAFRIRTVRSWSREFKLKLILLSAYKQHPSFEDSKGKVFAFLTRYTASTSEVCRRIRREVGSQMSGYRRELIALRYFEKIACMSTEVRGVRLSTKEEDERAIDLVVRVQFSDYKETNVPVQVKSRIEEQKKHMYRPGKSHIPSVVIPKRWVFDKLCRHMKGLLRAYATKRKILHVSTTLSLSSGRL